MIDGYNTSPAIEKAKYDKRKLCKYMGKLMFALAACWLVIASSEVFITMALLWIGLGLFMIVVFAGVTYMNTRNSFQIFEGEAMRIYFGNKIQIQKY